MSVIAGTNSAGENVAILLNPGTEKLESGSVRAASKSMKAFIADLDGEATFARAADLDYHKEYQDGRYAYTLSYRGQEFEIQMPGLKTDEVRFLGTAGQNIWDYPRLYVDGNSWVWKYALEACEDDE